MLDILDLLLDQFSQPSFINARNEDGLGALHLAVCTGNSTLVQRLLEVPGIDVYMKTRRNETAYELSLDSIALPVPRRIVEAGQFYVDRCRAERYQIRNMLARAMGDDGPEWSESSTVLKTFTLPNSRTGHVFSLELHPE